MFSVSVSNYNALCFCKTKKAAISYADVVQQTCNIFMVVLCSTNSCNHAGEKHKAADSSKLAPLCARLVPTRKVSTIYAAF